MSTMRWVSRSEPQETWAAEAHPGVREEGMAGGQRLWLDGVEGRHPHPSVVEGGKQGVLVDERARAPH